MDINVAVQELKQAFADFKKENDTRVSELKSGIDSDNTRARVDTVDAKVAALQKEIEDAHVKIAASKQSSGKNQDDPEYSNAFAMHMRKGDKAADIQASLNKGTAAEGGYLAPIEWDRTITDKLILMSPMRQIARTQNISTAGFTKLFNLRGTASGWVGETAARPETASPTFAQYEYRPGEIYANPTATQQLLDDAEINLESWLAGEVETEFAYQEGVAFLSGNGVSKPKGILNYVTGGTLATDHPLGAITVVNTGDATTIKPDSIISLIYSLPEVFTGNAQFIMNRNTMGTIRKLKDGQNNYLWQPSFVAGQPSTLAGYPVREMPGMPDVAANSLPVMFGDFNQGYLIVDRVGVRVLRDPFTNKPFVSFYTTKRVGGGLLNPQPLRALKIAV